MTKNLVWIIIGAVLLLLVGGGCSSYNTMVTKRNMTEQAWGNLQSKYQRRIDLIPNLVNTVKGSANFEQKTLTEITEMRSRVGQAKVTWDDPNAPTASKVQAANQMESALSRLLVISENYPQLKSTQAFTDLMTQLEGTENRISVERDNYNAVINDYNTYIERFPQTLFAGMFHFERKPGFVAAAGAEKAPEVQF